MPPSASAPGRGISRYVKALEFRFGITVPMPFSVSAYVDDQLDSAVTETANEALAKAEEWHVVSKLADVSISDGIGSYSIDEFSLILANASDGL